MSETSGGSEQDRRRASGPRLSRAALAATLEELRSLPNLFTAARLVLVVIRGGLRLRATRASWASASRSRSPPTSPTDSPRGG